MRIKKRMVNCQFASLVNFKYVSRYVMRGGEYSIYCFKSKDNAFILNAEFAEFSILFYSFFGHYGISLSKEKSVHLLNEMPLRTINEIS